MTYADIKQLLENIHERDEDGARHIGFCITMQAKHSILQRSLIRQIVFTYWRDGEALYLDQVTKLLLQVLQEF